MEKKLESLRIFFVAMILTVLFVGLVNVEITQEQKEVASMIVFIYGFISSVALFSKSSDRRLKTFLVISSGFSIGAVAWFFDYGFLVVIISIPAIIGLGYVLPKDDLVKDGS